MCVRVSPQLTDVSVQDAPPCLNFRQSGFVDSSPEVRKMIASNLGDFASKAASGFPVSPDEEAYASWADLCVFSGGVADGGSPAEAWLRGMVGEDGVPTDDARALFATVGKLLSGKAGEPGEAEVRLFPPLVCVRVCGRGNLG